jgi:CxxC-x17-CxxC domain-containing protein
MKKPGGDFGKRLGSKKFGAKGYGNKKFGGGAWNRDEWFEKPMMHKAVCNSCGASCEVPFKPNGRKPVLCSDCFRKDVAGGAPAPFRPRGDRPTRPYDAPSSSGDDLKAIHTKLDAILRLLRDGA